MEKKDEKQFAFFLGPKVVMEAMVADARGDAKGALAIAAGAPENSWVYLLLLKGKSPVYRKESIGLVEPSPCGSALEIDSGTIAVDWKAQTVQIELKLNQDGKLTAFIGNGTYKIDKTPIPEKQMRSALGCCERSAKEK